MNPTRRGLITAAALITLVALTLVLAPREHRTPPPGLIGPDFAWSAPANTWGCVATGDAILCAHPRGAPAGDALALASDEPADLDADNDRLTVAYDPDSWVCVGPTKRDQHALYDTLVLCSPPR